MRWIVPCRPSRLRAQVTSVAASASQARGWPDCTGHALQAAPTEPPFGAPIRGLPVAVSAAPKMLICATIVVRAQNEFAGLGSALVQRSRQMR